MPDERLEIQPSAARPWQRLRRVSLSALGVLWILAALAIVWVNLNERWGSGMRFAAVAGALFLCSSLTLAWFALLAPLRRRVRWGITGAILAVCLALAAMLRLEEVSGGLRPRFAFRWSTPADQRLARLAPEGEHAAATIDLTTVGEEDYARFLGADQRQSIDGVRFDTNWSEAPPRCVWRQPIGAGWSSFVTVNGYAVTQEQRGDQELITCYEIASGRLVWSNGISTRHETTLGGVGPRSTPCIDEGRVYALGATGEFRCLDGATGRELWHHDLLDEMQVQNDLQGIAWGRASSPLIVDQLVVIPVGGPTDGRKTSLIAFHKLTGEEAWRAGEHQISYASPVRARLQGTDQILIVLEDFVAGFDTQTGQLLWEYPWPGRSNANANVSNAVPLNNNRVFLSKGYGQGAELLELSAATAREWTVRSLWKKPVLMKTKLSNVIAYEGHVYGLDDVILECVEIESGRKRWKRGRFGYGQLIRAGNILIVLAEDGDLAAVEASPNQFLEHGRFTALEGKCWNNLCLSGPYLLVRNAAEAACYELPNWRRDASSSIDASGLQPPLPGEN